MKIYELFEESFDSFDMLFEDLGKLKEIDPELLQQIKKTISHTRDRYYGGSKTTYTRRIAKQFPIALGQNSPVESVTCKTAADLHRVIKEQSDVRAIVVKIDGQQCFAALKFIDPAKGYNTDSYQWTFNYEKLFGTTDIPAEQMPLIDILDKANIDTRPVQAGASREGADSKLYGALTALVKVAKALGKTQYEALAIKEDEKRKQARKDREDSRKVSSDQIPATKPQSGKKEVYDEKRIAELKKQALMSLQTRLSYFKEHNAPKASTPEELLKLIMKEGYLDKIKINNQTYTRSSESISINKLLQQQKLDKLGKSDQVADWDKSYISYRIDSSSDEWKKMYEKLKNLRELAVDDKDYYEMRKRYAMPDTIQVYLKFEGGSIVPYALDIEKFIKF